MSSFIIDTIVCAVFHAHAKISYIIFISLLYFGHTSVLQNFNMAKFVHSVTAGLLVIVTCMCLPVIFDENLLPCKYYHML